MLHGITDVRVGLVLSASVLLVAGGCQTPSHETGELYGMSEHFDGHVGRHMPLVFERSHGEPWVEVTLCQNVAEHRPEVALYNIHVTILSSRDIYDLQDNRLEFIADGTRISLARAGTYESDPKQNSANYPINVNDLATLAGAAEVRIRVNATDIHLDRTFDPAHLAALDEFYVVAVEGGTAPRHAGVND